MQHAAEDGLKSNEKVSWEKFLIFSSFLRLVNLGKPGPVPSASKARTIPGAAGVSQVKPGHLKALMR